ncbi:MAG: HAMP domain-containing histidine kinase [candidate division Zixibacteria bacterium]|nr:HAMP domain-containing histidine kinase [candidate division Zixibacteria bacterium]NIR64905.1 HAMP domain-containing histidine kinase [candidate division Zixibacteria bacterium]NIS17710.1 HAMP domain-containing histidine kinase [candidate division Zixibacteria bacterium]NIS46711.1 HAMP domain-containing histidine kinase [candidate division Zixibacteria bacterium]NIT54026.1 HAMP domain-containing histidine kinase [candidate division Zixibacteria bacterium]
MQSKGQRDTKSESLEFFGSITASVTHELMNVIAIINELTGLLDDMRYSAEQGQIIEGDRLESLHERLARQVNRGEKIIKRLNKFAHSADHEMTAFDLNEVLLNLVGLMQRLADMKKIRLIHEPSPNELACIGNPFELQHLIFRCSRMLLNTAKEDSTMSLEVQKQEDLYAITVFCSDISDRGPDPDDLALVKDLAVIQGWTLLSNREDGKFSFILTIPVTQTPESG